MSSETIRSLKSLQTEAEEKFTNEFGDVPINKAAAPGRVNIIGEHTDYNDGYVFPMALPMYTVIVGKANYTKICNIISISNDIKEANRVSFSIEEKPIPRINVKWANYVIGVLEHFPCIDKKGFDAVINSSVPVGAGVSSSAALEVSMFTFLEDLYDNKKISLKEKALLCQKAEHTYADVPCGIMDQFISCMGKKDHCLFIDCMDKSTKLIKFKNDGISVLITNSNVKHNLGSSEYPLRRKHCHEVAATLNAKSLRYVTLQELNDALNNNKIDATAYCRARHVVTENQRVLDTIEALNDNDFTKVGRLMNQSHTSLKDDFEVSCKEVDQLVEYAQECTGVFGSRITGGGFGGCTVSLVCKNALNDVMKHIKKKYSGKCTFYVCTAADGAFMI